jgi:hypothetical protein
MTIPRETAVVDEILRKQKELMDAVPHPLREDAHVRMLRAKKVIELLLIYLNSTGHKPWRPNPLPRDEQTKNIIMVTFALKDLEEMHLNYTEPSKVVNDTISSRILVSTFGGIEEILEFYDSWRERSQVAGWSQGATNADLDKENRAHMLEELTDELFYYLERMILVNFTWAEVINEYYRKWEVNMKRYADAKKGDYTWDDRGKKEGL